MKTFYFNTGVKISVNPHIKGGVDSGNGIVVIPFQCDDVPDNAIFLHACDNPNPANERIIVREIKGELHSKYAHFATQTHI